ncbi:MAG: cell division protein FtsW [Oscillospiraceae bacterium]|nr:cell division protein FtsW [Oscillospiraceae bacterium]
MPLLMITFILLAFGLVMLYSASYVYGIYRFDGDSLHYIKDQAIFAVIGVAAMLIASKVDYHIFRRYTVMLMGLVYILLIIVLFMPEYNGCNRWIVIKNIGTFQPSEIAKFAVIIMFANMIEQNYDKMKTFQFGVVPFVAVLASIVVLMFFQPHLSGIVIICAVGAIMMFIGGCDTKWFMLGIGVLAVAIVSVLIIWPDSIHYASSRIENWLHPENDLTAAGYQSYMGRLAIGSGGLFGLGLGNSRQKHLHLPEGQNDFIFAIICEELGFVGGMMVIILFIALFARGIYIATRAKDKFGAMIVIGIIVQITLQAFLNIAVATGTIPNTGISLPFFSEGGTALMMILGEMGIVLSVSRYANLDRG